MYDSGTRGQVIVVVEVRLEVAARHESECRQHAEERACQQEADRDQDDDSVGAERVLSGAVVCMYRNVCAHGECADSQENHEHLRSSVQVCVNERAVAVTGREEAPERNADSLWLQRMR